jgi:integrase/recombinase XerD
LRTLSSWKNDDGGSGAGRAPGERSADRVTADLAIEWATPTDRGSDRGLPGPGLDVVRIFARHLRALDPATEVPPGDVLARRYLRIPAYL